MENNKFAVNANLLKRSAAVILDFLLYIIFSLSLITYVIGPIYDQTYQTSALSDQFFTLQQETFLYEINQDTTQVTVVPVADVPDAIYNYYAQFKNGKTYQNQTLFTFSIAWFNTDILKVEETTSLFTLVDDNVNIRAVVKSSVLQPTLDEFYNNAYNAALVDLASYAPFADLVAQINQYFIEILLIAFVTMAMILYFIFPLIFKEGKTIGKKLLNLSVVNALGYHVKLWQISVRFIVLFATFVLAIYTIFGSILISYTFMIFSKQYRALHDFFAQTRVVDSKQSTIFKTNDARLTYEKSLEEKSQNNSFDNI